MEQDELLFLLNFNFNIQEVLKILKIQINVEFDISYVIAKLLKYCNHFCLRDIS